MAEGWISIHRKIEECWVWFEEPFSKGQAWVDLILMANHRPKKCLVDGKLTTIETGERLTSIRKLAERWQWSRKKVAKFLEILEKDEMIELKKSHHFTVIKVLKYDDYQGSLRQTGATEEPQKSHEGATEEPQTHTNNNDNNEKNENKKIKSAVDQQIESDFEIIYGIYPKKRGKAGALRLYKQWLKGRKINGKTVKLTREQVYYAVARYVREKKDSESDLQFYKDFDTLMREPILDYVREEEK